jgi:hypothetical protein
MGLPLLSAIVTPSSKSGRFGLTAHAVTAATPLRPGGTGGEDIWARRRGDFCGHLFSSGTTHARFGNEVEWNASNLVALFPAEGQ